MADRLSFQLDVTGPVDLDNLMTQVVAILRESNVVGKLQYTFAVVPTNNEVLAYENGTIDFLR